MQSVSSQHPPSFTMKLSLWHLNGGCHSGWDEWTFWRFNCFWEIKRNSNEDISWKIKLKLLYLRPKGLGGHLCHVLCLCHIPTFCVLADSHHLLGPGRLTIISRTTWLKNTSFWANCWPNSIECHVSLCHRFRFSLSLFPTLPLSFTHGPSPLCESTINTACPK